MISDSIFSDIEDMIYRAARTAAHEGCADFEKITASAEEICDYIDEKLCADKQLLRANEAFRAGDLVSFDDAQWRINGFGWRRYGSERELSPYVELLDKNRNCVICADPRKVIFPHEP